MACFILPALCCLLTLVAAKQGNVWNKEKLTEEVKDLIKKVNKLEKHGHLLEDNDIKDGDWYLVFRMTAGIGISAWQTYTKVGYNDDDAMSRLAMPCGCLKVDGSLPCDRHYRSRLLDIWPSERIAKVKVGLYQNGKLKKFAIFNGKYSSFNDWMSRERLLDSSWEDLQTRAPHIDFISLVGDKKRERRFFIGNDNPGCGKEKGWLVVKDKDDKCAWGRDGPYPSIFFSPQTHKINFNSNHIGRADVLAVWVKFSENIKRVKRC